MIKTTWISEKTLMLKIIVLEMKVIIIYVLALMTIQQAQMKIAVMD